MTRPSIITQINRAVKKHHPTLDADDASAQVWVSREHYDRNCECGSNYEGRYWNGGDGWNLEEGNVVCINMYHVVRFTSPAYWPEATLVGHVWFRIENSQAIRLTI